MRTVWIVLGVLVLLGAASFWYVARRDRARLSSAEDTAAARDARAEQEGHAAGRHGIQGEVWQRDDRASGG
ncbi:hypothetical protein AB0H57_26075 [Micromonospora sp. NPDC050686]|uniref:hypothetical protein n=1 Tax=Micromonospora sp. NPDC050686 TaxID=3154631 RepID=UPI003402FACA